MFKLQSYALPHNKLREHLEQVGTKVNIVPAPDLLQKNLQPTKQTKFTEGYYFIVIWKY